MPNSPSKDQTRQPAQSQDAEVEKLYESCCGSCGPTPTNTGLTLETLTPLPQGTPSGK